MNAAPYYSEPPSRGHTSTANAQLYTTEDESYDMAATTGMSTAPMFTTDPNQGVAMLDEFNAHGQHNLSASHLEDNPHLAELLAAAAKAGVQEAAAQSQANKGKTLRRQLPHTDLRGDAQQQAAGSKRKRTPETPEAHDHNGTESAVDNDLTQSASRKRTKHSAGEVSGGADSDYTAQATFSLSDARAAGVHSAAALFRKPSDNPPKKYTRPPMSKLFTSLQLTPENFLGLQAAAKQYMLDPAHPERQSCVGNRGKGDTDMVKLRLFNCVRAFLDDGIGDRFFGPEVPAPTETEILEGEMAPGRKWIWPRDGNKIVSLVTPLLRRMVTNERQRQYAVEARKANGGKKKNGSPAQRSRTQDSEERQQNSTVFDDGDFARPLDQVLHSPTHNSPTHSNPPPTRSEHSAFLDFHGATLDTHLQTVQQERRQSLPQDSHQALPQDQAPQSLPHSEPQQPEPRKRPEPQHQRRHQAQPQLSAATSNEHHTHNGNHDHTDMPDHNDHPLSNYQALSYDVPVENMIQILVTKHNTRLLPRLDLVNLSGGPHHTMTHAELLRRIEGQLKQLSGRGFVFGGQQQQQQAQQGERRRSPTAASGLTHGDIRGNERVSSGNDADTAMMMDDANMAMMMQGSSATTSSAAAAEGHGAVASHNTLPGQAHHDSGQAQHAHAHAHVHHQHDSEAPGPAPAAATTAALHSHTSTHVNHDGTDTSTSARVEMRASTGAGLVLVKGAAEWEAVKAEVGRAVWMEGLLRVVVEVL